MTDKLKNQSESNKQAQDNLHKQIQEQKTQLRSAQDRAQTLETSVTELTAQLADSKEKASQLDAQVHFCLIKVSTDFCTVLWKKNLFVFMLSISSRQRQSCYSPLRLLKRHKRPTWRTAWRRLNMHCRISTRLACSLHFFHL